MPGNAENALVVPPAEAEAPDMPQVEAEAEERLNDILDQLEVYVDTAQYGVFWDSYPLTDDSQCLQGYCRGYSERFACLANPLW